MSPTIAMIYDAQSHVMSTARSFAHSMGIREILSSPTSGSFEYTPDRTYFFGPEAEPELMLPASNTIQKQVACGALGSVFCVSPSYRRESRAEDGRPTRNLSAFHQLEFEFHDADMAYAQYVARRLVLEVLAESPFDVEHPAVRRDFRTLDLRTTGPNRPNVDTYDAWLAAVSATFDRPTWVTHLPLDPEFTTNRQVPGSPLFEAFELMLPDGHGEILSGGARDPEVTARKWFEHTGRVPDLAPRSSGFGVGLERLVALLLGEHDLSAVEPPHFVR